MITVSSQHSSRVGRRNLVLAIACSPAKLWHGLPSAFAFVCGQGHSDEFCASQPDLVMVNHNVVQNHDGMSGAMLTFGVAFAMIQIGLMVVLARQAWQARSTAMMTMSVGTQTDAQGIAEPHAGVADPALGAAACAAAADPATCAAAADPAADAGAADPAVGTRTALGLHRVWVSQSGTHFHSTLDCRGLAVAVSWRRRLEQCLICCPHDFG